MSKIYPGIGYRGGRASRETRLSKVSSAEIKQAAERLHSLHQSVKQSTYNRATAPTVYQPPVTQLRDERQHHGSYVPPTKDKYNRGSNMGYQRLQTLKRFGMASKGFLRFHPILGRLLNAWDLWKFFNNNNTQGQIGPLDAVHPLLSGWILQHDCGRVPTHIYATQTANLPWPSTVCFSSSLGSLARGINEPLVSNVGRFQTARHVATQLSGNKLYAAGQYYYQNGPNDYAAGRILYRQLQREAPYPFQNYIDPNGLPIQQPMPYPLPVPLQKRTEAWPQGYRGGYGPRRPVGTRPGQIRQPPRRRMKEQKLRLGRFSALLVRAANQLTEAADLVDALYNALPPSLRRAGRDQGKKAKAVYRHWHRIDWDTAFFNIVWMNAEDFVWGQLGLPTKPFGRMYGSNMGANKLLSQSHGDTLADTLGTVEAMTRQKFEDLTGLTLVK